MPFMYGKMPLRRTAFYLDQGKITFRNNVKVLILGYHKKPKPEQSGTRHFVFWHWAQLQYKNPSVQLVKIPDLVITPFAKAYLDDGREVLFDLEGMNKEEIVDVIAKTLGKSKITRQIEALEKFHSSNPANFGSRYKRQCICEMQGQQPCTSVIEAPEHHKGKWRWNHNLLS
uniref:Small ribosomal subunit protein mS25 n=1 Tax=Strongyloides papillosus TaxID=174720 RepID=A0A0N5CHD5_STREA